MIVERARLTIHAGREDEFVAVLPDVIPLFLRARGCGGVMFERSVENAQVFYLVVQWDQLEDHTVTFRASTDFQEWRRLAGPFFASAPEVEHLENVGIAQ